MSKAKNTSNQIVRIGIHYELPDGRIAMTTGWGGGNLQYCLDDDKGMRSIVEKDFMAWKPRPDLKDFPNARDPRLPHSFDLLWDIKTRSQLVEHLKHCDADDEREVRNAMTEHRVVLTPEEATEIDRCRYVGDEDDDLGDEPGF